MNKELPSICFVGLNNIPVLVPEYRQHGIGGEQVQQTLIAKALVKLGYNVSMVVGDYGQEDGQSWDGIKTYKTYKFDAGLPIVRFVYPRWSGIWSALKRANADVYYVSCAGMQLGLVTMFAKWYGKKVVFRIASDADCIPDRLLVKYWRDKKLYEYGLKHVDHILSQGKQQSATMYENYKRVSQVAGMMVDGRALDIGFDARNIPVLWVSNLRQLKRPDLVLELATEIPQYNIHMVGGPISGSRPFYYQIEKQASNMNNVHFHGQIPYQEVNNYFEYAKVFINTSDTEGFPNSYLQSWVRGTPVIAFFDPDRIIEKEGLGRTVSSLDEMKDAILTLLSDASEWQKMSFRCLEFMKKEFNEEKILKPYISAFHNLNSQGR